MTASDVIHIIVPVRTAMGLVMIALSFYLLLQALADRQEFRRRGINGLIRVSMNSQVRSCWFVLYSVVVLTCVSFTSLMMNHDRQDYEWIDLGVSLAMASLLLAIGCLSISRWWERHEVKRLSHEYIARSRQREGSQA